MNKYFLKKPEIKLIRDKAFLIVFSTQNFVIFRFFYLGHFVEDESKYFPKIYLHI